MKIAIVGMGGFGREVYWSLSQSERESSVFFVDNRYCSENSIAIPISELDPSIYKVLVAVGNPVERKRIVESLPSETVYFTHIHASAQILGNDISIGEGSIICANTIITTNVKIGKHSHINLSTTIGHDCEINDFFTTAPGVHISGNSRIGKCVYFGTGSSIKEKLRICDNVTVGMNAAVVKDISVSGVYVGIPAKLKDLRG
jgi:sugar O-acyltransferase (sialic acid O-acetyltransferase NeuD family)